MKETSQINFFILLEALHKILGIRSKREILDILKKLKEKIFTSSKVISKNISTIIFFIYSFMNFSNTLFIILILIFFMD